MAGIYSYNDYREFLRDELSRKRGRNASFSVRAAAQDPDRSVGIAGEPEYSFRQSRSSVVSHAKNLGTRLIFVIE